jgi:hypothetical protein
MVDDKIRPQPLPLLTYDDLCKIHAQLKRRFAGAEYGVVSIGLGFAEKRRTIHETIDAGKKKSKRIPVVDPSRGICARFYVKTKVAKTKLKVRRDLKGSAEQKRLLPPSVTVRFKSDEAWRSLTLQTDVVRVPKVRITTAEVEVADVANIAHFACGGIWIAWKSNAGNTHWGLLTVGHPFRNVSASARVYLRVGNARVGGSIVARSAPGSKVDAAIVEIDSFGADRLGIPTGLPLTAVPYLSGRDMGSNLLTIGISMPADVASSQITVQEFIREYSQIDGLWTLNDIVRATAGHQQAFAPGTSGSPWFFHGTPGCMQVAGRDPGYSEGYGQALITLMAWAGSALRSVSGFIPGSIILVDSP